MSNKIMQAGIRDIFDVFMLLVLIAVLALEWLDVPVEGWRRIGAAVLLAAIGSLAGATIRRMRRS
jgi:hypothetical protein